MAGAEELNPEEQAALTHDVQQGFGDDRDPRTLEGDVDPHIQALALAMMRIPEGELARVMRQAYHDAGEPVPEYYN